MLKNIFIMYAKSFLLLENHDNKLKNYWLVMEYADCGTLRNYLKQNFEGLTWEDKYNFAYQLSCAVLCLHDERIVHRDLVIKITLSFYLYSIIYIIYFFIIALQKYTSSSTCHKIGRFRFIK